MLPQNNNTRFSEMRVRLIGAHINPPVSLVVSGG